MKKVSLLFLISLVLSLFCLFYFEPSQAQTKSFDEDSVRDEPTLFSKVADRLREVLQLSDNAWTLLDAPIPTPQREEEFEGDVEQRRQWFLFQRTFPFDKVPEDARRKAFLSRPTDAKSGNSPTALQWQQIGPRPTTSAFPNNWGLTSGRINAVAVSPSNANLVLIGAATGGVWRSTDGGATFNATSDSQVDLAVGSIAFAPSNNSIVYAGMGDVDGGYLGTGVLRSTDGGVTWTRVSNTTLPSPGTIAKIEVDPTDPNRVYVAQFLLRSGSSFFSSGFFLSTDGGVNWTKTFSGLPRDLVRHPTSANIIYLSAVRFDGGTPSTGGIWKSTNSGTSWTRVYTSPFASLANIKIAVTPAAPQNLYVLAGDGGSARVEVSTNEGGSWTNRGSNFDVGQFGYNCYLFVHPTNTNTIYVGTRDLWRSTDGGTNYTNITNNFTITGNYNPGSARAHPDQHHFYISPTNPNTIYVANDGGVWKSTDGAGTFSSLNSSLALTMFTSYDMHPTDASRSYGGTQDNGTQKRTGSQNWREFISGDGGQTFVDPLDPSIVYTTYIYRDIYRFTNNGDAFSAQIGNDATFAGDRTAFYPPFVGNDLNSNLYFGTYRLYVSTNRGASWTAPGGATDLTFGGGTLSAIAVARSNTNVIYTGASDGRVMVSSNGGANWTDRTAGLPQRFIKSIRISPTDPNTAYLTVSGYSSGHVFKTTNAGANWTDLSGNLPDIPTNALLIDPRPGNSNTLYVGTDIGVFRSTVGGTTWETFNTGLPPTIISELDAQSGGLMQVGTYGRGAYEINLNDAGCTYSLNPTSQNFTSTGGSSSVNVITGSGCPWTATVNAPASPEVASASPERTIIPSANELALRVGLTLAPSAPEAVFLNSTPITINDRTSNTSPPGTGSLYPSTISVSGMTGTITQVTAAVNDLSHTFPDDIDVLLIGPGGQRAILMSDVGGSLDVSGVNLTFDQSAAALPDETQIVSGTYRPTSFNTNTTLEPGGVDDFPAPAPGQAVYGTDLSVFNGTAPNGTWQLFVVDDEHFDGGNIATGWALGITTSGGATSWINITSGASGSGNGTINYTVSANPGTSQRTGTITVNGQTHTVIQSGTSVPLRIDDATPKAGRATGGQPVTLTGAFAGLSTVTIGGVAVTWSYTSGTSAIAFNTPAHAVGAVDIVLTPASGSALTKTNAFAYLPITFTDNTLTVGVTTVKAQHILELRQAVDALRAVAGLGGAPWADATVSPFITSIRAVHITELRFYLEDAAQRLGYTTITYTDPGLSSAFQIKRLHIEELRQRLRTLAG